MVNGVRSAVQAIDIGERRIAIHDHVRALADTARVSVRVLVSVVHRFSPFGVSHRADLHFGQIRTSGLRGGQVWLQRRQVRIVTLICMGLGPFDFVNFLGIPAG